MSDRLPAALAFENVSLRERIDHLERDLHNARREVALLTDERDIALGERDRLEHRLLIARGEGGF